MPAPTALKTADDAPLAAEVDIPMPEGTNGFDVIFVNLLTG